jgi:hypothetical protein
MRTTGAKRAVRRGFYRLGLHATPKAVVHALQEQGVQVDEEFVRAVLVGMLQEATGERAAEVPKPGTSPAVRRRPQGSSWR